MKSCYKCGETKHLEEFVKDPKSKGGYRGICRSCHSERCGIRDKSIREQRRKGKKIPPKYYTNGMALLQRDDDKRDINKSGHDSIMKCYFKDLRPIPIMSEEEEINMFHNIKRGQEPEYSQARERIIYSYLRYVITLAKKYIGRGFDFSDIVQQGNIGLMHAVDKFKLDMGVRFGTYAAFWIQHYILRMIHENSTLVHIPMRQVLYKMKYYKAIFALRNKLNSEPNISQISKYSGLPEHIISFVINDLSFKFIHLETPINDQKANKKRYLLDFIPDENAFRNEEEWVNKIATF